jgi:hypothetical protein
MVFWYTTNMKNKKRIVIIISIVLIAGFIVLDYSTNLLLFKTSDELSVEEIKQIKDSVGSIICPGRYTSEDYYEGIIAGSGIYMLLEPSNYNGSNPMKVFITNEHVAQLHKSDHSYLNHCTIDFIVDDKIPSIGNDNRNRIGFSYSGNTTRRGDIVDIAILVPDKINDVKTYLSKEDKERGKEYFDDYKRNLETILENHLLNDNGKSYPICEVNNPIGNKIYVFGYPSSADTAEFPDTSTGSTDRRAEVMQSYETGRHLIMSEGIISGNEGNNFFTTALIDTGSSGGVAIMKENNEPCIFGIPTWGTIGDYTTLGIIQPFSNVFTSGFDWNEIAKYTNLHLSN